MSNPLTTRRPVNSIREYIRKVFRQKKPVAPAQQRDFSVITSEDYDKQRDAMLKRISDNMTASLEDAPSSPPPSPPLVKMTEDEVVKNRRQLAMSRMGRALLKHYGDPIQGSEGSDYDSPESRGRGDDHPFQVRADDRPVQASDFY